MNGPFRASYLLSGVAPERAFAALLDVRRFPEWASGLRRARVLDAAGENTAAEVRPGTVLEFTLTAAGLTHRVVSAVTVLQAPHRLEWRYTAGAAGSGGWLVEEAGDRADDPRDRLRGGAGVAEHARLPAFFRALTEQLLRRSMRRLREGS